MNAADPDSLLALIFSKDRAMQLQGVIDSLRRHLRGGDLRVAVLFKATTDRHRRQYEHVKERNTDITFIPEADFRAQILRLLDLAPYVLFLVDDNLFVRDFDLARVTRYLASQPTAAGFSLRLGMNVRYDYMHDRPTRPPRFERSADGVLRWDWRTAEHDFAYPLEVSSSVYRRADLQALLAGQAFNNPNQLEGVLAAQAGRIAQERPWLLSFEQSVTFCNPVNLVQTVCANRAGADERYRADQLAALFDEGVRIDVQAYDDFVPTGCHQEVPLAFRRLEPVYEEPPAQRAPPVTIEMVTYNSADTIGRAITSALGQTFGDFELMIVDDGSTDDTERIVRSFDDGRIRYVRQPHRHAAAARNRALAEARGKLILVLDSDDALSPEYLADMMAATAGENDVDFFYPSQLTLVDEAGRALGREWSYSDFGDSRTLPPVLFRTGRSPIPNPGSLIRRSLFERVGSYEEVETVEDFVFLCRHALQIRFRRVDLHRPYYYRFSGMGLSHRFQSRNEITARVLDEMVRDYRPQALCPPLAEIADPRLRTQVYYEYVMMTFYALAQVHGGRFGTPFRCYGDHYRARLLESLTLRPPSSRCLWMLVGRARAEAMVAAAQRALAADEPDHALVYLDEAANEQQDVADLEYGRAVALARLGQVDRALEACERQLRRDPDHARARTLRRSLLEQRGVGAGV